MWKFICSSSHNFAHATTGKLSWHMHVLGSLAALIGLIEWWNTLQWRHNGHNGVSNHHPHDCLLNRLFRSKMISKLPVTCLCAGNSPVTGEFPAQMASNAENVFIWWRHHEFSPNFNYEVKNWLWKEFLYCTGALTIPEITTLGIFHSKWNL